MRVRQGRKTWLSIDLRGKALWIEQPGVDDERMSVTWIVTEETARAKIPEQGQMVFEAKQGDCVWRGCLGRQG